MLYFCNKIKHRSTQSHDFVSMTVLTGFYASWRVEQSLLNLSDWRSHGFLLHLQKPIWVSVEFLSMFIYRNPIWQAQNLLVYLYEHHHFSLFFQNHIFVCVCAQILLVDCVPMLAIIYILVCDHRYYLLSVCWQSLLCIDHSIIHMLPMFL